MIRALRRRLAAMLLAIIGVVLIATTTAALLVSEWQMNTREDRDLRIQANALLQQIRMGRTVIDAQIGKTELDNRLIIHIRDNGAALLFRGSWEPLTPREALAERALADAAAQGVPIDTPGTVDFAEYVGEMRGDARERYLVYVAHIGGYRNWQTLVLIKDTQREDAQRLTQRLLFAGIALAGIGALAAFGWWFTGRAMRPIEEAHRQQTRFVAAASHELRTPLAVMQTGVDALSGHPEDPARFLSQMQREIDRMSGLTRDLMALTNAHEAMSADLLGPVELDALLEECYGEYRPAAEQKGVALTLRPPEHPLPIAEGDARRLKLAINVLIDNAISYTPTGGRVDLCTALSGHAILLRVEDNGLGIAPEHEPHIFERFYRAEQSRTDRSHNGLGLSIAREITLAHRGKLTFRHNEPRGSVFEMKVPTALQARRRIRKL